MRFKLRVIPEPEPGTRSVLVSEDVQVIMTGELKGVAYDCGSCGLPVIKGVMPGQVRNIVIRCTGCGAYNETDALPDE